MDTIDTLSVIAIMLVIVIAFAAMVGFFVVHPGHIKIQEREGTQQYTEYSAPSSYPIPDHSFIQSPLMTGGCLKCDRPSWVHPGQVKIEEPEGKS